MRDAWRRVGDRRRLRGGTVYTTIELCLLCAFVITQFSFGRVVFAARGTDVPTYKPLLGAELVTGDGGSACEPWAGSPCPGVTSSARGDNIIGQGWRAAEALENVIAVPTTQTRRAVALVQEPR